MAEVAQSGLSSLVHAFDVATGVLPRRTSNGIRFASYGETRIIEADLQRIVKAVPVTMTPALADRVFYFVPLAMAEASTLAEPHNPNSGSTLIARDALPELLDEAICHRNVHVPATLQIPAHEGVFISARLLRDTFSLAFEFFINVGHAFAEQAGIPETFSNLVWSQALADIRGETSQDAWEIRTAALAHRAEAGNPDEKARLDYYEATFADALAIYQLSLAVDFDYTELREREYPLIAPNALADRLRLVAALFPPNAGYDFAIRYRRRA